MNKTALILSTMSLITSMAYAQDNSNNNQPSPTQSASGQNSQDTTVVKKESPVAINCQYNLKDNNGEVSNELLTKWADFAATHAFDYSYLNIDKQLSALEPCFTKAGWQSYNKALTESGNIAAIKEQQLMVSSQLKGQSTIKSNEDKKWQVIIPLEVSYESKEQRITQLLNVTLDIGLKISGNLGINQIIATSGKQAANPKINTPTDAASINNATLNSNVNNAAPSIGSTNKPTQTLPEKANQN